MVVVRKRRTREGREKKGSRRKPGLLESYAGIAVRVGSMLAVGRGESTTYSNSIIDTLVLVNSQGINYDCIRRTHLYIPYWSSTGVRKRQKLSRGTLFISQLGNSSLA